MIPISSDAGQFMISGHPDVCPFCHNKISPKFLYGHRNIDTLEVTIVCPSLICNRSFIGYYENVNNNYFDFNGETTIGNLIGKNFSEIVVSISENFIQIYNQAFTAEQQGLAEICGVGYRKALEYLIKDYLIFSHQLNRDLIGKKQLSNCISEYVIDEKIKTVAKRAAWLGNDETHYIRKWEGKNLEDLKKLIDLTVHWIEMESLTKSFELDMPDL